MTTHDVIMSFYGSTIKAKMNLQDCRLMAKSQVQVPSVCESQAMNWGGLEKDLSKIIAKKIHGQPLAYGKNWP